MSDKEYRKMTEEYLLGRKVTLNFPLKTRIAEIPKGTTATITGKFSGLSLQTEPCSGCGCQHNITRVEPYHVELVPKDVE